MGVKFTKRIGIGAILLIQITGFARDAYAESAISMTTYYRVASQDDAGTDVSGFLLQSFSGAPFYNMYVDDQSSSPVTTNALLATGAGILITDGGGASTDSNLTSVVIGSGDDNSITVDGLTTTVLGGLTTDTLSSSGDVSVGGNLDMTNGSISNVTTIGTSGDVSVGGNLDMTSGTISNVTTISSTAVSSGTVTTTGNVIVGGNLDMDGGTISNAASVSTTAVTTGTMTTTGNATVGGNLDMDGGAISNVTTIGTSGDVSVGGNLDMTNGTINNLASVSTTAVTTGTMTTTGNATVGGNLDMDGGAISNATSIAGAAVSIESSVGSNVVLVREDRVATIAGDAVTYGTAVTGGLYVDGDLGVNGHIYSLDPAGSSGMTSGDNGLTVNGGSDTVTLVADSDASTSNGRSGLTMQTTAAALTVNTAAGEAHGISIDQTKTVLSGGQHSTSLTLNDDGATFENTSTGGPARVSGVADGKYPTDAVNYRQLSAVASKAYAGIASVSALAAIPPVAAGKTFAVGAGTGCYQGENALAIGARAATGREKEIGLSLGVASSREEITANAGISYSW